MIETLGLSWEQAAILAVAFFAGGFAKGGTGFAFPLLVIPIASPFAPLDLVLAIIAMLMPFVNILQFTNGGRMRESVVRFWPMLAGLAVGAPLGALLFPFIDQRFLALGVGLLIVAFVFWTLFRPNIRIPPRSEKSLGGVAGVAAGVLGTLTTTNGPVFVTYLVGVQADRKLMISALGLFFLVSGLLIVGSFITIGVLNGPRALIGLGCFAPCFLGMWAGNVLGGRIPQALFRQIVLGGLLLLGANMIVRSLLSF
jgi:uncharacterized membrane protein YfcA